MNRLGKNSVYWPTTLNSTMDGGDWYLHYACPLAERMGLAIPGDTHVPLNIIRLFLWRAPSHIAWLIVSIIVDAVNAKTWLIAWRHIIIKCLEGIKPPITNVYAAAAISAKPLMTWIAATPLDAAPNAIERVPFKSMRACTVANLFSLKASTTTGSSPLQIGVINNPLLPTVTETEQSSLAVCIRGGVSDNGPTSEALTDKIGLVVNTVGGYVRLRHGFLLSRRPVQGHRRVRNRLWPAHFHTTQQFFCQGEAA